MKTFFRLTVLLLTFAAMKDASAQDVPPDHKWSFGAGVGFGITNYQEGPGLIANGVIERRLTRHLSLLLDPHVSAGERTQSSMSYAAGSYQPARQKYSYWNAGADVGLRYVINPGGIIEVSPLFTVGSGYGTSTSAPSYDGVTTVSSHSASVSTAVGIALERELIPNLYLRLSTNIVGADYSAGQDTYSTTPFIAAGAAGAVPGSVNGPLYGPTTTTRIPTNGFHAGLALNPTLSVRMAL